MTDPMALTELEAYWASLSTHGRVPDRSAVDPAALGALIEDCMILERVAPGVARIRVAGQNVTDLAGSEARGLPLSVLFHGPARAELTRALEECFRRPAIVELPLISPKGFAQPSLQGRLILLPLRDGFGQVSRCLAALVADGRRGRGGRRFVIDANGSKRKSPVSTPLHIASANEHQTKKAEDPPVLRLVVDNA